MVELTSTSASNGTRNWYLYWYRCISSVDVFITNDDWLKCIEATSDELHGAYSKTEDNALSTAFEGRNKKRLNRVFDAIGFVYPDYCYPLRGQGIKRKIATSGKVAALAITAEPKGKKMKVLTHRPRYIEPAVIPEFGEGISSAAKAKENVPIMQSTGEATVMPKVSIAEPVKDKAEESKAEKIMQFPKILSPPTETTLPKVQKASAATPKRRRMANVLDVVLETTKALSPVPTRKVAEAAKAQPETDTKKAEVEATKTQAETEVAASTPAAMKPIAHEEEMTGQTAPEKVEAPAPEASNIDYIIHHASGKELSQEEMLEARHYAQIFNYLKGALVFNGSDKEDFLYCLPDNKEISVCQDIGKSIGFPKLEDGLSILSKDELVDSLAYSI
jgi:hypothetical protein